MTFKKANLTTQGEDEVDFGGEEEEDEKALLCLMALNDEIITTFDSNFPCSSDDNDIDYLYHKLYDSLVRFKKGIKMKMAKNESLTQKIKCLEKENHDLNLLYLKIGIWVRENNLYP